MTLEDAIAHAKAVARENRYRTKHVLFHNNDIDEINACTECAEEHEQLAEWLEELQRYRNLKDKGMLIELPCFPDEEVWESNKRYGTHRTIYASKEAIVGAIENGYVIGYTKEEAEAKLKEEGEQE